MDDRETLDVAVATLNSGGSLERCLEALRADVPVGRLVVVDGGSRDDTVDIARRHGAEVVVDERPLGAVTYRQAELLSGEWFLQLSSDVALRTGWWEKVRSEMREGVALITVLGAKVRGPPPPYYQDFLRFRAVHRIGYGGCVWLLRRETVLSCRRLLDNVHAHYDAVLVDHIRRLGLRIVLVPEPLFDHPLVGSNAFRAYRIGVSAREDAGLTPAQLALRLSIPAWTLGAWADYCRHQRGVPLGRRLRLLAYLQYLQVWSLLGYLFGTKTPPKNL